MASTRNREKHHSSRSRTYDRPMRVNRLGKRAVNGAGGLIVVTVPSVERTKPCDRSAFAISARAVASPARCPEARRAIRGLPARRRRQPRAARRPRAKPPNQPNQPRLPRANLARAGRRPTRQTLLRIPVRRSPKVKARNCWPSSVASSGPTGRQIADDRGQRRLRFGERVAASRFTNLYARMAKILECSCNQEFPCSNAVENFGEE